MQISMVTNTCAEIIGYGPVDWIISYEWWILCWQRGGVVTRGWWKKKKRKVFWTSARMKGVKYVTVFGVAVFGLFLCAVWGVKYVTVFGVAVFGLFLCAVWGEKYVTVFVQRAVDFGLLVIIPLRRLWFFCLLGNIFFVLVGSAVEGMTFLSFGEYFLRFWWVQRWLCRPWTCPVFAAQNRILKYI